MKSILFTTTILIFVFTNKVIAQNYKNLDKLGKSFVQMMNDEADFESFHHMLVSKEEALSAIDKGATDPEVKEKLKEELRDDFDAKIQKENLSRWKALKSKTEGKHLELYKTEFIEEEKMSKMLGFDAGHAFFYVKMDGNEYKILIDKAFKLSKSWRINEIGSRLLTLEKEEDPVGVETSGEEEATEETEEAAAEIELPEEFQDLIGKWKFHELTSDGKNMTQEFIDGRLDGGELTMEFYSDGVLEYNESYQSSNNFKNCRWDYLSKERRSDKEPNIDFLIKNQSVHGGTAIEKYTLVEANEDVLKYKNNVLDMHFTFTRIK